MMAVAAIFGLGACQDDNDSLSELSDKGFFSQETLSYNLTTNPEIVVPVVRLGNSGDLTVNVSTTGASEFSVPSTVTIKDGDRIGEMVVTYNESALTFNQLYTLQLSISGFNSIYGYQTVTVNVEKPTSYFEYGKGTMYESWWFEEEEKTMYARDFAANVYQCYLPDCWGHDSGPSYDVQDYIFYWNTATNKVYLPLQFMGCENWHIADLGAIACKFGGPGYAEGSTEWFNYIDNFYRTSEYEQPHYDPDKKTFFLSDSAARDPETGENVYGSVASVDTFVLE